MDIQELQNKVKALKAHSNECADEWSEWMIGHTRNKEDVHYCQDTCPIAKICKDANIDTCGLLIDVLEVFKNQK